MIKLTKFLLLLPLAHLTVGSPAGYGHGHGYSHGPHPKCTKEVETITRKFCRLEFEKSCTTETITFTKITGYEKGECEEVEFCKHGHGYSGHHGHHGYHGKRSAEADHGYVAPECEKGTKEVCKQVPVKEELSKDIDKCTRTPKEVCEDKEVKVPKIICEEKKEH